MALRHSRQPLYVTSKPCAHFQHISDPFLNRSSLRWSAFFLRIDIIYFAADRSAGGIACIKRIVFISSPVIMPHMNSFRNCVIHAFLRAVGISMPFFCDTPAHGIYSRKNWNCTGGIGNISFRKLISSGYDCVISVRRTIYAYGNIGGGIIYNVPE